MGARKNQYSRAGGQSLEAFLAEKANWVRIETFKIHKLAPETRVASSLSNIEILTALYYGDILKFDPKNQYSDARDRFIISKGHGSIAMYPILADHGFFEKSELSRVCHEDSFLGGIPDPIIPGYETINGSLGHGLGVGCGMAFGLKSAKKHEQQVFVMAGDGELNEGSMWEAIMFAAHHKLDNLNVIVDKNQKCMLDYTVNVINMEPLAGKFKAFGFQVEGCDGHDVGAVHAALTKMKAKHEGVPKVLICETIKGKGSPKLEANSLCHVMALNSAEVDETIARLSK